MEPSHSYARLDYEPAVNVSEESHCFRVDETLDYVKDALEHLSDNDELFVSNRNDIKAAPNMSVFRINCSLLNLKYHVFTTMMYMLKK